MKLSDFDYNLPKELIAQQPVKPRDHSRLMVLDKKTNVIKHDHFYNLLKYLNKDDVLVFNDTKVFPARLIGEREETGGRVEVFLLRQITIKLPKRCNSRESGNPVKSFLDPRLRGGDDRDAFVGTTHLGQPKGEYWEVLIGNKKKRPGMKIIFSKSLNCEIIKKLGESTWLVRFSKAGNVLRRLVDKLGQVPLPPYIKTEDQRITIKKLKEEYQTVYAKYRGSVAAPTAGFHFTKKLLTKIKKAGMQTEFVTLHVGLGTFQPVKEENILKHQMHAEWASLDKNTAKRLNQAKADGKRIVAVGTTTVRVLEAFTKKLPRTKIIRTLPCRLASRSVQAGKQGTKNQNQKYEIKPQNKLTKIFIYPGYKFKFADVMITNFHLPKSTLLMLISALVGRKRILKAYQEAIKKKYRFYSFGDAMLIT